MSVPQGVPSITVEPQDEAAARRRAAESINESLAVEAGAGTGKTTLLVTRIVNLLRWAKVDQPARPARLSEIVAITFTEKAAGELKSRLRDVLELAVATARFQDQPISPLQRDLLADSLQDLDRAQVSTIHSFCASMIRERPVEADIDPGRTTADALTQSLLFEETWQRWREQAYENRHDSVLAAALHLDVKADRGGPDDRSVSIRDLAETLVHNRDLLEHLPQPIDEQSAWDAAKSQINCCAQSMQECLKHTKTQGERVDKPSGLALGFLNQWNRIHDAAFDDVRAPLVNIPTIPAHVGGDARRWKDTTQLDRLRDLLAQLRDQLLPDALATVTHNLMVHTAHRLQEFVTAYDQLKKERGLLDFQDLLLIARRMLRDNVEVREYFRDRYRFLLVDEFQDTDPLQAEVAMLLSQIMAADERAMASAADPQTNPNNPSPGSADAGRLFLVGDPKQSIYRFRRADIEVFDQCQEWIGRDHQLRIRQNFRSGSNLIAWVNRVFAKLIESSTDGHYQPDYSPLLPGPSANDVPGQVVLLMPPEPEKDCKATIEAIRYREGCCIAQFIKHAIDQEWPRSPSSSAIRMGDVAVLLPQMTGLEHYEEAFRACGLKYQITGGKHFYQRVEIKSLINVVTAIDNPEDGIAVVAALRSPFFGCSDEDLLRHALAGGAFNYLRPNTVPAEPLGEIFQLLARLHHDRHHRPIAAILNDFFAATKGLEGFLTKPNGESRVANLLKVVDSARLMERADVLTFRGFARWLRDRQTAREEEAESPQAEPGEEAVQVLTIHKSKGLEFPMTVIADLQTGEARPDDRVIFDRLNERLYLRCGPLRTAGWREAQEWDLRRAEAERRRLFYVAATRARDYLVLPVFWRKLSDHGEPPRPTGFHKYLEQVEHVLPLDHEPPWGQRLTADTLVFDTRLLPPWPEPIHTPRVSLDQWATDPAVEQFLVDRTNWAREHDEIVKSARRTRPVVHASELVMVHPDQKYATEGVGGREIGTLVHRLLELHLTERISRSDNDRVAQGLATTLGVSQDAADVAAKLVNAALSSTIVQRIRDAKRVFYEVPFSFADGGRTVEGRIDVLAEEPAGLLLIDFKTDHVQPGHEPGLAAQYAAQLRAYAAAIQATTGKSVQSAQLVFLRTLVCVEVQLGEETEVCSLSSAE